MSENEKNSKPCLIPLGNGKFAIVDADRYDALMKFTWRAVKARRNYYAKTTIYKNGLQIELSMHRFIARTPSGFVCHHKNRNPLDNRFENLANTTKYLHRLEHWNNPLKIKYETPQTNQII